MATYKNQEGLHSLVPKRMERGVDSNRSGSNMQRFTVESGEEKGRCLLFLPPGYQWRKLSLV